jgi:hypothetical protein
VAQKKDKPLAEVHERTGKPLRIISDLPESLRQALGRYHIQIGLGNSKKWIKVTDAPYDGEMGTAETEQGPPKKPRKKRTPADRSKK